MNYINCLSKSKILSAEIMVTGAEKVTEFNFKDTKELVKFFRGDD